MNAHTMRTLGIAILASALTALAVFALGFQFLKYRGYIVREYQPATAAETQRKGDVVVKTVQEISPAVVSITVTKNVPIIERYFRSPRSFFDFFNGDYALPQYRVRGTQEVEVGGGSGFFVSSDGYIITNRHVVSDPEASYTVLTNDGKKHEARIVARNEMLDIAVAKIEGTGFPYLEFGNSDALNVGQTVIAIGNALGEFRNTVSVGVVSGLGRSITAGDAFGEQETLEELIQTDAAINPGNSGGPLLDIDGKVIGVNVAVASGAQNVGFALPAKSVKGVLDALRQAR